MVTIAPSPPTPAAPEVQERRAYYIAATLDGYVKVFARSRDEARETFETMNAAAIAAGLDLWADDPKLKDELPEHEQEKLDV